MSAQLTLDLDASIEARETALQGLASNNPAWFSQALGYLACLDKSWAGTGEDLRSLVSSSRVGSPKHHNAWGSLVRSAIGKGLIERTGRRLPMRDVSSHARMTDEYRCV